MSEWIYCKDRLPDTEESVLCGTKTKKGKLNLVIGYFIAEDNYWACGMNNNVIAWMALPELPEEVE